MTESQLAEEVRVVADVAAKKATSAMYIFMVELMAAQGIGRETAETFMQSNMSLATPSRRGPQKLSLPHGTPTATNDDRLRSSDPWL